MQGRYVTLSPLFSFIYFNNYFCDTPYLEVRCVTLIAPGRKRYCIKCEMRAEEKKPMECMDSWSNRIFCRVSNKMIEGE